MAFKTICVDHVGIACAGTLEEAAKIYQEDHQDVKIDIVEVGDVWNAYIGSLNMYIAYRLSILYFTEEFCRRYYWSCKIINDIYKERD